MWTKITEYWVIYVCGILAAGIGILWRWASAKFKSQHYEKQALLALLHNRLYCDCKMYIRRGWCSIDDKEDLKYMFEPYEKMGGNGICKHLYLVCVDLPIDPPERRKKKKSGITDKVKEN